MNNSDVESTNQLLRVMIALMLRRDDEKPVTLRQQTELLHDLGLRPIDIARILGRKDSYVNKELAGIRKSRK